MHISPCRHGAHHHRLSSIYWFLQHMSITYCRWRTESRWKDTGLLHKPTCTYVQVHGHLSYQQLQSLPARKYTRIVLGAGFNHNAKVTGSFSHNWHVRTSHNFLEFWFHLALDILAGFSGVLWSSNFIFVSLCHGFVCISYFTYKFDVFMLNNEPGS